MLQLYTKCKKCRKEINFFSFASDRFKLAKDQGDAIELICENCHSKENYHVNDIKAEGNKIVNLLALFISIFGTIGIWLFIWDFLFKLTNVFAIGNLIAITIFPSSFYSIFQYSQRERIRYFNIKYYI
ncbi:hypothetical protein [Flexithrix dorotheae]|uniref:hypothetical protein n=1 Tax=Flexithrix dorotheae TaxID=70993 RepID=UPI000374282A|nr:hypothetical protein [Flexithrix dorotheae]